MRWFVACLRSCDSHATRDKVPIERDVFKDVLVLCQAGKYAFALCTLALLPLACPGTLHEVIYRYSECSPAIDFCHEEDLELDPRLLTSDFLHNPFLASEQFGAWFLTVI